MAVGLVQERKCDKCLNGLAKKIIRLLVTDVIVDTSKDEISVNHILPLDDRNCPLRLRGADAYSPYFYSRNYADLIRLPCLST